MRKLIAPAILAIIGASILFGLCVWQIERLAWKEQLLADIHARMNDIPLDIKEIPETDYLTHNYAPVVITGRFIEPFTDLLSGSKELGGGYRRILVMESAGQNYMVEAGFLTEDQKQASFELPKGEVTIEGHLYTPIGAKGSFDAARNIWVGYDVAQMAAQLNARPVFVSAKTSSVPFWQDTPLSTNSIPNNHLQYAITWFLLGVVWLIMSAYWGFKRMKKE